MFLILIAFSCAPDIGLTETSLCDGELQRSEDTVDSPFDRDGDGYFDGTNPGCQSTYAPEDLDCDDLDPEVHPGQAELECNGLDDDCDEETPDADDADEDGFDACDDCNDFDETIFPGAEEVLCDGLDNDCLDETPDAPDVDEDGFAACSDCDDTDPGVNPDAEELICNGVDDDCSAATPDAPDEDLDTWSVCDGDCDDGDSLANPGELEICDDGVDNDCNGDVDEDCEADYSDTWFLDKSITYSCAFGYVELSFSTVDITHSGTNLLIEASGTKGQPGKTSGSLTGSSFTTTRRVAGGCTEEYTFNGSFSDPNTFSGTFKAAYTGSGCWDCSTKSWAITGTR